MSDDPRLLAFAEDPSAFVGIGPDEERVATDRAVVTFTPGAHFWSAMVARVRFGDADIAAELEHVRTLMRARGYRAAAWSIGPSARPADVVARLTPLGLERESEEGSSILLLTDEPDVAPTSFEVRPVTTFEDHLAAIEIAHEGFAQAPDDVEDDRRRAGASFDSERIGGHVVRALVLEEGRPIATGRAWFAPQGVYLGGAATIPSHRRRGAMASLVGAAWAEAVGRGTPAVVTFGGAMSAPAFRRLGFRVLGRIEHLIDRPG